MYKQLGSYFLYTHSLNKRSLTFNKRHSQKLRIKDQRLNNLPIYRDNSG